MGDPGRLQASHRDAGRGGKAGAGRGDRRRCSELADPVRRLRRSRARPSNERRDDRVSRSASRRGSGRGGRGCCSGRPDPGVGPAQRKDRPGVRSSADRARCGRACPRRPRAQGDRNGIRRTDVHPGRTAGRIRGRLGRALRRRKLPKERPRRERLGDPDRAPSSARLERRQAGGALSSRAIWKQGGPIRYPQPTEKRRGHQ